MLQPYIFNLFNIYLGSGDKLTQAMKNVSSVKLLCCHPVDLAVKDVFFSFTERETYVVVLKEYQVCNGIYTMYDVP